MTFAELYRRCRQELSDESADFDLLQLFRAHFSDTPGLRFSEKDVNDKDAAAVQRDVKRLADGYPLQYLLGEWEFYGITLKVGEGVLIPQPDTETVVDVALELAATMQNPVIADYGSGSGAIALALARHLPTAKLYAVENSPAALNYLFANVQDSPDRERIVIKDDDITAALSLPVLDMIVSNPPYLTEEELENVPRAVACEPREALSGGKDGLDYYRAIAKNGMSALKDGGWLVFEAGYRQAQDICAILAQNGYVQISARRDLCGVQRCIFGQKAR